MRFTLRDAAAAEGFDELVSRTLEGIRQYEAGTVVYVNHRVPDEPGVRVFYELYESRAAFDAHERQPHVRRFLEQRDKYVTAVEVTFLDGIGGKVAAGAAFA
ncbi:MULTISPECIES: antibiotic biosynthesis monooxygenase [Streptomyces]|uniref:putative quinol monooxygenase n=1 Tax=Streptomyces TaxID=1883 RepID=UPI0031D7942C